MKISKSKPSRLSKMLKATDPFGIERCKSNKGTSVSMVLALLNCSPHDKFDWIDHAFKIRIVNVEKVIEVHGASITSDRLPRLRNP